MKNKMLKVAGLLLLSTLSVSTWAESFVLKNIQVSGLDRITAETVKSNIPVKIGEKFDDKLSASIIRSIYKTGFFDDVQLGRRDNTLLVKVHERSVIGEINLEGNHKLETKVLLGALKQAGISQGRPLDKSALNQIQAQIKQQYLAGGNYSATVKTELKKLDRNRVAVNINIHEGGVARIKRVNISGNKAFSEQQLLKIMESGTKSRFSFFSDKDKYAREKLVGDIDKITSFYRDRGYLNFQILSSQVSLSDDKQSVFVNINIKEGDRFHVGNVHVGGDADISKQEAKKLVRMKKGQVFSQTNLSDTRNSIQERLGKEGFAFSKIAVVPQIDNVNKRVNLIFQAEKGQRVYVRRINIRGNFRTKDVVIRREMRQLESTFLSKEKVRRSKVRIQRLPFIESVRIATSPVAGRSDQVDLDVIVKDAQSSNDISASIGYSGSSFLFNVGLKQNNFMGLGKSMSVSASNSKSTKSFNLSYNNPYHTVDGVGRGVNVYLNKSDAEADNVSDYSSDTYGATLNYTIPMTEDNSIRFSLGGEHRKIKTSKSTPDHIKEFVKDENNGSSYNNIIGSMSYIHDTRNRFLFPSEGKRHSISLESGLPGGDLEYYKVKLKTSTYHPVTEKMTFALKGGVSYGSAYGSTSELPFFEKFYSGGIGTVRGFEHNSLGPQDSNKASKGGAFSVDTRAELLFPVPFLGDDVKGLRMSAFVDGGNVFEGTKNFKADELRFSTGLATTWISPIGPFTLSYAKPLNAKKGDDEQKFQFSIGANF